MDVDELLQCVADWRIAGTRLRAEERASLLEERSVVQRQLDRCDLAISSIDAAIGTEGTP
jgi:hypothetical protein